MKKHTIDIPRHIAFLGAFAAIIIATLAGCSAKNGGAPGMDSASSTAAMGTVEHGKYLVTTVGCNDCHTPWTVGPNGIPGPDMTKMLSGHPAGFKIFLLPNHQMPWMVAGTMTMTGWYGPWGISFAANLTPDSATGIGTWTQDQFMNTLKTGKHLGAGRAILPPMPWQDFAQMTDADLASMYMYLKTIPPISNQVPAPMPPSALGPPPGAMPLPPGAPQPIIPPLPPGAPVPPPHRH